MVVDLGCFKELYIEYNPIFAPISQGSQVYRDQHWGHSQLTFRLTI